MAEHHPGPNRVGCRFGELDDPAREHALVMVQQQMADIWSDGAVADELAEAFTVALADAFGAPSGGGIPDVEVTAWSPHPGRHLTITGVLRRDNAPSLPWRRHIGSVTLTGLGRATVHTAAPATTGHIAEAVHAAIATAWLVADQRLRRRHALEWIAGAQPVFDPAGTPLPAEISVDTAAAPMRSRRRAAARPFHVSTEHSHHH